MLFRHKEFIKNHLNYAEENVILIENGDVLELDREHAQIIDKREIGRTFIDDSGFEEIDRETVRERKQLAFDGVVSLVVKINSETKKLDSEPLILTHGVMGVDPTNGFVKEAQRIITEAVEAVKPSDIDNEAWFKEHLRVSLKRFLQKQTGSKPVIIPTVVRV
jgi:ribonuclease J